MPHGRMKHLQLFAGRIYNLLKKEAAFSPNTQLRTSGQRKNLRHLSIAAITAHPLKERLLR
jgi:hypothetical protein